MPQTTQTNRARQVPIDIVGSSNFGLYPKVNAERTYNMFISQSGQEQEQWLISFAGYRAAARVLSSNKEGRGLYHSIRGQFLLIVVAGQVTRLDTDSLTQTNIGTLNSDSGEVFFDENLNSQIAIVDGQDVYIYNHRTGNFGLANLRNEADTGAFTGALQPNYVTYQNTFFIFGNGLSTNDGSKWYVFDPAPSGDLNIKLVQTLSLQTKPDYARAAVRMPGRGNNLLVMGESVAEIWSQVGGLQTYQRNTSINIDYGVISVSTIAANDQLVVWLGNNERATPSIYVSQGGNAKALTTDGIDNLLNAVQVPSDATGFLYEQDNHWFYQLTFFNSQDNFTIVYDFETNRFFDLVDFDYSHFPARQIAHFLRNTYFVSIKDGRLFRISTDLENYQLDDDFLNVFDIPRMRVCNTIRAKTPAKFITNLFSFILETGTYPNAFEEPLCFGLVLTEFGQPVLTEDGDVVLTQEGFCRRNRPRIDLRLSKDGGTTYSNAVSYELPPTGDFINQPRFFQLGRSNDLTLQLQFWGMSRFVIKNGALEIRT